MTPILGFPCRFERPVIDDAGRVQVVHEQALAVMEMITPAAPNPHAGVRVEVRADSGKHALFFAAPVALQAGGALSRILAGLFPANVTHEPALESAQPSS